MVGVRATKEGAEVTRLFWDDYTAQAWVDFMPRAGYVVEMERAES